MLMFSFVVSVLFVPLLNVSIQAVAVINQTYSENFLTLLLEFIGVTTAICVDPDPVDKTLKYIFPTAKVLFTDVLEFFCGITGQHLSEVFSQPFIKCLLAVCRIIRSHIYCTDLAQKFSSKNFI